MSKAVMKEALEALKYNQSNWYGKREAIAALEAALAQPEFDTPESHIVKWSIPVDPNNFGEAQPEHPLDKKADNARKLGLDYEPDMSTNQQNVNTSEKRVQISDKSIHEMQRLGQELEQEPVAWMLPDYGDVLSASEADGTGIYNIPLYTAPPKREWVGLTDEEILSAAKEVPITCIRQRDYDLHFAPIIEAKLKEKNNAV